MCASLLWLESTQATKCVAPVGACREAEDGEPAVKPPFSTRLNSRETLTTEQTKGSESGKHNQEN